MGNREPERALRPTRLISSDYLSSQGSTRPHPFKLRSNRSSAHVDSPLTTVRRPRHAAFSNISSVKSPSPSASVQPADEARLARHVKPVAACIRACWGELGSRQSQRRGVRTWSRVAVAGGGVRGSQGGDVVGVVRPPGRCPAPRRHTHGGSCGCRRVDWRRRAGGVGLSLAGVSWTTRTPSAGRTSTSTWKPSRSA
jgi:hypothetical protein